MITNHTEETLIKFEERVCDTFMNKEILAPVHLYSGNEKQMIDIFQNIKEEDWLFCSWRSHYQCLLKGVPEDLLMDEIKKGHSISLNFKDYKIFSTAIVTGNIPIATGVALSNKLNSNGEHVYCFVGDMTSETGCFSENYKYALNYDLPITFVIEDNSKSDCTDTKKVWNSEKLFFQEPNPKIIYFQYEYELYKYEYA